MNTIQSVSSIVEMCKAADFDELKIGCHKNINDYYPQSDEGFIKGKNHIDLFQMTKDQANDVCW